MLTSLGEPEEFYKLFPQYQVQAEKWFVVHEVSEPGDDQDSEDESDHGDVDDQGDDTIPGLTPREAADVEMLALLKQMKKVVSIASLYFKIAVAVIILRLAEELFRLLQAVIDALAK